MASVVAIIASGVGTACVLFSMVAMTFTMGFGTRVFFPYFVVGVALLAVAVAIGQREKLNKGTTAFVALCRWTIVIPLLISLAMLVAGYVEYAIIEGKTVHGAVEWFVILIVVIPVLAFPELRWASAKLWHRSGLSRR
jgi:hypothetical protein